MGFLAKEIVSRKSPKSALFCYFMSLAGSVFSIGFLIVSMTQFSKHSRPDVYFALGFTGLAASSALAGFGTVAENSKHQTEILRSIASAKN